MGDKAQAISVDDKSVFGFRSAHRGIIAERLVFLDDLF